MKTLTILIIIFVGFFIVFSPVYAIEFYFGGKITEVKNNIPGLPKGVPGTRLKIEKKENKKEIEKTTVYIGGAVSGECKKENHILGLGTKTKGYAVAVAGLCCKKNDLSSCLKDNMESIKKIYERIF